MDVAFHVPTVASDISKFQIIFERLLPILKMMFFVPQFFVVLCSKIVETIIERKPFERLRKILKLSNQCQITNETYDHPRDQPKVYCEYQLLNY